MRYLGKNYGSLHFFKNSTKYEARIHSVETGQVVLRKELDFSFITNVDVSLKERNKYWIFIRDQLRKIFLRGEIIHFWIVVRKFKKLTAGAAILGIILLLLKRDKLVGFVFRKS